MRERRYSPCNLGRTPINLGKQGEANHLRIEFDCSAWLAEYPDAVIRLYYFAPERAQDDPRRPVLGEEGTDRVWLVSESDTANAGNGVIELVLEDAFTGTKIKSATGYTTVTYSPSAVPMSEDDNDSGGTGEDGGYYKPSVSSSGDLSWTPSKASMPSVNTVNIRGPEGKQGQAGYTPQKGVDYFDGAPGDPGTAATFTLVGAESIPYGSKPTVTEAEGSTPQDRRYTLGIPEGKPGTNGNGGSVELDSTLTDYTKAANAGAVGNAINQEKQAREQAVDELKEAIDNKVNKAGWTANKYLGTDADGNVVEKNVPSGTGGYATIEILEADPSEADMYDGRMWIVPNSSTSPEEPDEPDEPDEPVENGYTVLIGKRLGSAGGIKIEGADNRLALVSTKGDGVAPALDGTDGMYYAIPVPTDATGAVVTCGDLMWGISGINYENETWTYDVDPGWTASGAAATFEAGACKYAVFNFKQNNNANFATDYDVSGITFEFV